ncbi:MAG: adenine deaminase [Chloroflexi bacterium]|nr:MAG: adenine deaminase [Chloroflexota bacterium]
MARGGCRHQRRPCRRAWALRRQGAPGRLRRLPCAWLHRRPHAHRVVKADGRRVRSRGAGPWHHGGGGGSPRDRQRARHRRHPLAPRLLHRSSARRLRDGLVVCTGLTLRIAAAALHDGRHREPPSAPPHDRCGRDDELPGVAKLTTGLTDHIDGHAPGLHGPALNAYLAAGIRSDHEATTYEEALEKRRLGMWVMLREASIARNLRDLLPLVKQLGSDWCMFCTDDREPGFIVEEGHVNQMVRVAVAEGISPEDAIVMATINPATYHRLWHLGAIAPGYQADIVVLDDLVSFQPRQVLKRGATPRFAKLEVPGWVRQTVHLAPVSALSFRIPSGAERIRVIRVIPGQLLTATEVFEPSVRDGAIVADTPRDLVKISVLERHHASGRIGLGFATGVGLKRGAFASTVAHDAHNVVVLGVDDADMAACACRLADIGGGIVIAEGGRVVEELPLPVAGLMSDQPLAYVHDKLSSMERRLAGMGVSMAGPFMSVSFLALSVIPELKITDRGLVDVSRFELVPLGLE